MFARIENGVAVAYPVEPRAEQPNTSFPWDWPGGVVNGVQYAGVRPVDVPVASVAQRAVEVSPALIDGVWTQTWMLVDLTPEQQTAQLEDWRRTLSVSPLQIRRALRQAGLFEAVSAFVSSADDDVQDAWEYATQIDRDNPLIVAAAQALSVTDAQVDDLFRKASEIRT